MPDVADPLAGFNFMVKIDGKVAGYFTEVSGLGSESEIIEHKVMSPDGKAGIVQKIPGRLKWGDITLKRGITSEMDVWTWRKLVEEGSIESARANGSIFMLNEKYEPVAEWDFLRCWPSKVSGPSINAGSSAVGIEEMVIVHEGITRVS
jgi:phage tail-like protein